MDLFQGQALAWYRSVRSSINSWEELVAALRRDFLPPDLDVHIAYMQNLFGRLSEIPTENVQLKTIRKNSLPAFQDHLAVLAPMSVQYVILESSF